MIDAHVHLGSIPQGDKDWGSFAQYRDICKKAGISRYCVVPVGLPKDFVDKTTPNNESVLEEARKDKSIIPVYWFNVWDLPEKIDSKYKAIKFHPDIGDVNIDDERVVSFVKKINLPVFVHTKESDEFSNISKAASLARKVLVPVIAVHSGSVIKVFFRFDNYDIPENLFFEISGIQYAIILKKIYERLGASRIILGSDYPFGDPRVALGMIESLSLSSKEKKQVTEENIERILGLNP